MIYLLLSIFGVYLIFRRRVIEIPREFFYLDGFIENDFDALTIKLDFLNNPVFLFSKETKVFIVEERFGVIVFEMPWTDNKPLNKKNLLAVISNRTVEFFPSFSPKDIFNGIKMTIFQKWKKVVVQSPGISFYSSERFYALSNKSYCVFNDFFLKTQLLEKKFENEWVLRIYENGLAFSLLLEETSKLPQNFISEFKKLNVQAIGLMSVP